ncbi:hypothetical protein CVT24_004726 [Panaeolus cyanescens]|uniref:Uncharacterized protein n=1 Tax=Panaeolus cyanescens TaxID=181874 RepID=A0A409X4X6_9AGAR|nr:hypothetical protein CVT24_004726 [Panaeolus cyanescens]
MHRRSTGTVPAALVDFTIREDELEHHRIQLEHNLQNTEISFHLSSSASSDNDNDNDNDDDLKQHRQIRQRRAAQQNTQQRQRVVTQNKKQKQAPSVHSAVDSSIEYPRHLSEPSIHDVPSFVHRSRDHFTGEDMHRWSYRPDDDEDGIAPYGHETVSTVNHHASALTLNAGLGGGRARRERSLSGAEYDPDRPLHAMIAGVNSKHSMSNMG